MTITATGVRLTWYTTVVSEGVTGFDCGRRDRGSEPRKPTSSRESVVGKPISADVTRADLALAA
jgi:hypothetical protein